MAAEGMPFPWRGNGSTISIDLAVIWEMSVHSFERSNEMAGSDPFLTSVVCTAV